MAKHLKINIKNTQIAEALKGLKSKLAKKSDEAEEGQETGEAAVKQAARPKKKPSKTEEAPPQEETSKELPRKARTKSVFAEGGAPVAPAPKEKTEGVQEEVSEEVPSFKKPRARSASEELRRKVFGEEADVVERPKPDLSAHEAEEEEELSLSKEETFEEARAAATLGESKIEEVFVEPPVSEIKEKAPPEKVLPPAASQPPLPSAYVKLGPTGRHIKDLLPPPRPRPAPAPAAERPGERREERSKDDAARPYQPRGPRPAEAPQAAASEEQKDDKPGMRRGGLKPAAKDFKDVKPAKRQETRSFDGRDRQGLRDTEEDQRWRKKRMPKQRAEEVAVVRPTSLKIRVPISIKDLAAEMKLKSAQLIAKLFLQGVIVTLNDLLEDETTIQLLGQEFGCDITLDTSEEQRIRITDKSIKDEIRESPQDELQYRPPVVAFMGHVDHGKTSLIDAIRKSNRVAGEAGAITQHIGAFRCHTPVGDITILDTPGHEAFSAMRARGADVTDIVVLVVAGDEGMKQQTIEALQQAQAAKVTIVVAINKADKPGYNPETVYRQLAEQNLLPEVWGGQTLTVNCSAVTNAGIKELLETLALQAEILELKANPKMRSRGMVIETEMHKGMGAVATVLVQNGTLRIGDALVFEQFWGRVKTMRDEFGLDIVEASPSTPVLITGLSGLPEAGQEFIAVKNEREAREIAEVRMLGMRQLQQQRKVITTAENLLQQATPTTKKILNIVLRADVQGSLEALRVALQKIESTKAEVAIISAGVGEISESDIQLASTSKAVVIGFHTKVESHAESLIKQHHVQVRLHDIIYHAIDDVKVLLRGILDKIAQETDKGKALVKALFKSSQAGVIAGCEIKEGLIQRSNHLRVVRNGEVVGKSSIISLRKVKEDVREVSKGMECGIVLGSNQDILEGDILEAYEVTYITQEL